MFFNILFLSALITDCSYITRNCNRAKNLFSEQEKYTNSLSRTHHEQCQPHHDPEAERRRLFKLEIEERGGESQGWWWGGGGGGKKKAASENNRRKTERKGV